MGEIRKAAPKGAAIFWDNAGRNEFEEILPVLADGARIVVMSGLHSRPVPPVGELYTRDISIHGFVISKASSSDLGAAARVINSLLAAGRLRTRIGATLPLRDAARAHRLQERPVARTVRGAASSFCHDRRAAAAGMPRRRAAYGRVPAVRRQGGRDDSRHIIDRRKNCA